MTKLRQLAALHQQTLAELIKVNEHQQQTNNLMQRTLAAQQRHIAALEKRIEILERPKWTIGSAG